MIQDVLPAAVVVELPSREGGVLQGKRGPYVLQFEGTIPRSADQRRIVTLANGQIREYLLQQNVRYLIPGAVLLVQLILLRVFLLQIYIQGLADKICFIPSIQS